MTNIVIFSGTTEGRRLSELLARERLSHIVCVATTYGAKMMQDSPYVRVRVGRMDSDAMRDFLEREMKGGEGIVIDATHPYAQEATVNIKNAAASLGIRYIRIRRSPAGSLPAGARVYADIRECARGMDDVSGNILMTSGSKELPAYCEAASADVKGRTYVRILPAEDSLKLCREQGIEQDHIVAMQGPFSRELNEALIRQYAIQHLITKESGIAGGFKEKMEAALSQGAALHVIARPADEDGVSVEEVFCILLGRYPDSNEEIHIALVGMGMGARESMTIAAAKAIEESDAVFGSARLLCGLSCACKYEMYRPEEIIPVLEKHEIKRAAIVFSGDTGFYSGAKAMSKALREWRKDLRLQVYPGVSSYVYLAARLGESYDDAAFFSLHGKNTEKNLYALADKVRYHEKTFVILSGAGDVQKTAKQLAVCAPNARIYVGARLSGTDELLIELDLEEAMSFVAEGVVTIMIKNPNAQKRCLCPGIKDGDFIRTTVPMTKECIRHESIMRLGLCKGDVLYDIGGGTGSVAIEAALLDPSLDVYTFEKKQDAAELIRQNIQKLGAFNVKVIEGEAEKTLLDQPRPDCVFIGGTGGRMEEIIDILRAKGENIRFVVNAVTLETIEKTRKIAEKCGALDMEAIMVGVSDIQNMGSYHMLRGQNPVCIFSFTI